MNFLKRRKLKKEARLRIHHALHLVNMRGDLLGAEVTSRIQELAQALSGSLRMGDERIIREQGELLSAYLEKQSARNPHRGGAFRENFEIIVVAVAAAMGLRAYFIQPFKIPTGSMQPTLYGITSKAATESGLMDRFPLDIVKFAFTGEWYSERRALADGRLGEGTASATDPSAVIFNIGGRRHAIPRDALHDGSGIGNPRFNPSRVVKKGDILWSGVSRRGDHLFVNKVIWNFRHPRRDEVMVFTTDAIPTLEPGTHYIKRMCGLPGERIAIHPPHLLINGEPVAGLRGIDRVTAAQNGYDGYQLDTRALLNSELKEWPMRHGDYFALGDNTGNSRDSRFWGPVPAQNLVGPAVFVYWPFSKRWGLIR
jgi:signal peptidase I